MRSEAVASLRSWMRDRLGEQEEQLRVVERGVTRLRELDDERVAVVAGLDAALGRLSASGVDEVQVAGFVGVEIDVLRTGRSASTTASRRASATDASPNPINGSGGVRSGTGYPTSVRSGRAVDSTRANGPRS